ncbi:MAG: YihA family ribosome biogenesis GTP-binding protein [Bacteroidales bacterium]|nr:YihA family ribosome biogenesis GTP-binding protein [Bacteroidales bacterium]
MVIRSAKFVISSPSIDKCPKPSLPEYAFIGRSNVGKSSLINMITGIKTLAKVSQTPGKTQIINHFLINEKWYIVDLPGYGYAKVSKTSRKVFSEMITSYIQNRENLYCLFVLIDSRLEPQKIDTEFISWLGKNQIPFALIFTKTDKINTPTLQSNIAIYKKEMLNYWEELPKIFTCSAVTRTGRDEIIEFIEEINTKSKSFLKVN